VDEQEQERRREMSKYSVREFFRLGCFIIGWIFLGVIISLILTLVLNVKEEIGIAVYIVFIFTAVIAFPILSHFWKPANTFIYKVLGNKNLNIPIWSLPTGRLSFKKYPWYYYLPSLWGWLMLIALLYVVIKYLK